MRIKRLKYWGVLLAFTFFWVNASAQSGIQRFKIDSIKTTSFKFNNIYNNSIKEYTYRLDNFFWTEKQRQTHSGGQEVLRGYAFAKFHHGENYQIEKVIATSISATGDTLPPRFRTLQYNELGQMIYQDLWATENNTGYIDKYAYDELSGRQIRRDEIQFLTPNVDTTYTIHHLHYNPLGQLDSIIHTNGYTGISKPHRVLQYTDSNYAKTQFQVVYGKDLNSSSDSLYPKQYFKTVILDEHGSHAYSRWTYNRHSKVWTIRELDTLVYSAKHKLVYHIHYQTLNAEAGLQYLSTKHYYYSDILVNETFQPSLYEPLDTTLAYAIDSIVTTHGVSEYRTVKAWYYSPIEELTTEINEEGKPEKTVEKALGNLTIYPNPTNHYISFALEEKIVRVILYDLTGKKVMEQQYLSNPSISVGHLTSGNYLVKLNTVKGWYSGRFIKE